MTQGIKGERGGEAEEHEEREEHTKNHAHQPDTIDAYPHGSMDRANRIRPEETRGRIPRGETGGEDESRSGRESENTRISHYQIHTSTRVALITEG